MDQPADLPGERVTIGRITRTQGRKGEVFAELLTDFPHRFQSLQSVYLHSPQGKVVQLSVERAWLHKHGVVIKLGGIDSIDAAEAWVSYQVQIPQAEVIPLPADSYYWYQLEDCEAFDPAGRRLGRVRGIEDHGGNTLLALETDAGREILVPTAKDFVLSVDVDGKRITLQLPEGLAGLNP